jgi:8-oxo-dGTP diphosphatase
MSSTEPTPIAIAVVVHAKRVLVGRRPADAPLAGYWEFPGGKVQEGELPSDAAARECREETGLTIRVGPAYAEVVHQYKHGRVRLHFFAGTPDNAAAEPLAPFRWVPLADLAKYRFPEANREVIDRLLADGPLEW